MDTPGTTNRSPTHRLTHLGYVVRLYRLDGAWVAEVEGTDLLHVMQAYADDTLDRPKRLVREWIEGGMQWGGPSA